MYATKAVFALSVSTLALCNPTDDKPKGDPCDIVTQVTDADEIASVTAAIYNESSEIEYFEIGNLLTDGEYYFVEGGTCWLEDICDTSTTNWWEDGGYYYTVALLDAQFNVDSFQSNPNATWWNQWSAHPKYETVVLGEDCF